MRLDLGRTMAVASALAVAVFLSLCLAWWWDHTYPEGDTGWLVRGTVRALRCLEEGKLTHCPEVKHFPIVQYLPTAVMLRLGVSFERILNVLCRINTVAFLASLAVAFFALRRVGARWLAPVGLAVLLASPLLLYASSSFNEMTAAFLILAFTAAVASGAPAWSVALTLAAAGTTKEVAPPILLALGAVAAFPGGWREPRRRTALLIAFALGAALAFTVNAALNLFRYGHVLNVHLLTTHEFRVPSLAVRLDFFVAQWVSPGGGVALYWPTVTAVWLAALAIGLWQLRPPWRRWHPALPPLGLWAILFGITWGLAGWFAPFGWWAWGPRLLLPYGPAAMLLALSQLAGPLRAFVARRSALWAPALGLTFALASLPNVLVLLNTQVVPHFFDPDATCPGVPGPYEGPFFYRCMDHYIWTKRPMLTRVFDDGARAPVIVAMAVALAAACALLFLLAHRLARAEQTQASGGGA